MRLAAYAGASVALAAGVILKSLHQRANFYSACVYLSQSSANLMILTNLCLMVVGFLLYGLQRLLYGPLRPIETEQLYEKAWFAVTETCLAMTIFRGELGGWFLVMFVCLLVGKVWGWIGEGRLEILEQQPPPNPLLFHTRLATSLILSVLFDSFMLKYSVQTVLEQARPDMMVMFGFEFAVLTILSTSTAARYTISLVELYITHTQKKRRLEERRAELRAAREEALRQRAGTGEGDSTVPLPDENDIDEMELDVPGWEEKGRWVFYLDLVTDFFKLVVYLSFFAILFTFYGLPIHILRDVVVTIRSFGKRIVDFVRYRNATRDMNERYPDATAEDISREDVCIICREEMVPWAQPAAPGAEAPGAAPARPRANIPDRLRPKKLPCGHILHFSCLRSWLERQQNCPTCRRPVVVPQRNRAFNGGAANNDGRADGAAGAQPGALGQNQPVGPMDGQPRARIYQFGPFRIGFGAGRGDLFQNLHQQLHQGPVPPAAHPNVPPGAQQIGFGFGFGRPPPQHIPPVQPIQPAQPAMTNNFANMQGQLQQIEQQMNQEINNLRVAADQLHVIRLLQAELQRLRNLQDHQNVAGAPSANVPVPPAMTLQRQFFSSPQTPPMGAGDNRLPEGLTLPPGWTLLPLHNAAQGPAGMPQPIHPPPPAAGPTPTTQPPTSSPAQAPAMEARFSDELHTTSSSAEEMSGTSNSDRPSPEGPASVPASVPDNAVRPESPSQEWTDVLQEPTSDNMEGPSGSNAAEKHDGEQSSFVDPSSPSASSSSKGKSRVATVEEVADDDA
ncbi:E3 ubiquitin-protein ligase hrd1 [Paecilomyces lecythidis]